MKQTATAQELEQVQIPHLVFFYQAGCAPCHHMSGWLPQVNQWGLPLFQVPTVGCPVLAQELEVTATPALAYINRGSGYDRLLIGASDPQTVSNWILTHRKEGTWM